ncbi:serine/threonine-protein kinase STY46-like isoform X2 [Cynara cardunculus var. scolymus]|uniref:serine/threonine-protein kinase STY46-like isoform X2 n=1 Tax=Cynara cardunculus var. scolymus TaxID=59895 RepID=UPI000D6307DE|nr:serine/threonine-protein kinase STY46-like isoform X2 [Cynara cardunculus var. scolymus]
MDLVEGVGESSSPPRSFGSFSGSEIVNDVYNRLVENGNEEAINHPEFRDQLEAHFNRFPASYALDISLERVEDVLLHQKLLVLAKDPENRPVFHVRLLENFWTRADVDDGDQQGLLEVLAPSHARNQEVGFEPCSKLEDLNLEVRRNSVDKERVNLEGESSRRVDVPDVPIHEVIFSAIDKPKLLSQLSALLSDIELNIREAHVFSTTDGYSLDVFVVDGWPFQETVALHEAMEKAISRSEGSWSGSSHSMSAVEKALATPADFVDAEIDRRLLKIGERLASGSCGDLYRGEYLGQEVAVKILRSEHLNESLEDEFAHEVAMLREVQHSNIVRFVGACTKQPPLCIITEYMPGGSLYEYLHKNHNVLKLPQLLKFAIDVCKGMDYLHKSNIIHRDLKTANLLMDSQNVVKVADFGVARFLNQGGVMTAETGTYRWMAPEVINHQPYDQKADVFSFAIVLWELLTAKVPYEKMTPLQAALGVRQGLRPEVPTNTHPKLLELMQRCWESDPANRLPFPEIRVQLEGLLHEIQDEAETPNGN